MNETVVVHFKGLDVTSQTPEYHVLKPTWYGYFLSYLETVTDLQQDLLSALCAAGEWTLPVQYNHDV